MSPTRIAVNVALPVEDRKHHQIVNPVFPTRVWSSGSGGSGDGRPNPTLLGRRLESSSLETPKPMPNRFRLSPHASASLLRAGSEQLTPYDVDVVKTPHVLWPQTPSPGVTVVHLQTPKSPIPEGTVKTSRGPISSAPAVLTTTTTIQEPHQQRPPTPSQMPQTPTPYPQTPTPFPHIRTPSQLQQIQSPLSKRVVVKPQPVVQQMPASQVPAQPLPQQQQQQQQVPVSQSQQQAQQQQQHQQMSSMQQPAIQQVPSTQQPPAAQQMPSMQQQPAMQQMPAMLQVPGMQQQAAVQQQQVILPQQQQLAAAQQQQQQPQAAQQQQPQQQPAMQQQQQQGAQMVWVPVPMPMPMPMLMHPAVPAAAAPAGAATVAAAKSASERAGEVAENNPWNGQGGGQLFREAMAFPNAARATIPGICSAPVPAVAPLAAMPSAIVPLAQRRPQPSLGSAMHGTGQCNPCAHYWKERGCMLGFYCDHCHMCPPGELRRRKKEKQALIRQARTTKDKRS